MPEAYLSAQFKYGSVFYGQMERNWGPVGIAGIGRQQLRLPQVEAGLLASGVPTRAARGATRRPLEDEADSAGRTVHRYFFAHRLGARLSDRLRLGLWETSVLSGVDREFDGRYRNPLSLLLFANQYGLGADGNVLFGLDGALARRRADHARGAARHRRSAVREHLRRRPISQPLGLHRRRLRPARPPLALARVLHPGVEPRLPHARSVRELHRRRRRPRPELRRHGPAHGDGQPAGRRRAGCSCPSSPCCARARARSTIPSRPTPAEAGQLPQLFIGDVERTWRAAVGLTRPPGTARPRA